MKPKSTEHQGLPDQGGLPGHDRLGSTLDAVVSQRMAGPAGPGPGAPEVGLCKIITLW